MKLILPLVGFVSAGWLAGTHLGEPTASVVWVGGNTSGYLSPCGCVKPMTGGIRRKATLLRQARQAGDLTVEVGPFTKDQLRQSQLKFDAMAEYGREVQVDAMGLMAVDTRLDDAVIAATQGLSDFRLVQSQASAASRSRTAKGWVIGAISPRLPGAAAAWESLRSEAGSQPILVMFEGNQAAATEFARAKPELRVVCYPSTAPEAKRVEGVMLVGTGERGKYVGRFDLTAMRYKSFALGPEYKDDPAVSRLYRRYLDRVKGENLIALEPRSPGAAFAGSMACAPCHGKILQQWSKTEHAKAFTTLKTDHHDFDPDCVKCHVVGKDKTTGFQSEKLTPKLMHVGCESCHGPARDHAKKPKVYKLGKAGPQSCQSCHVPDHSPSFDFESYWKKIQHGRQK